MENKESCLFLYLGLLKEGLDKCNNCGLEMRQGKGSFILLIN